MTTHKTKKPKGTKKDFAPHVDEHKAPRCHVQDCGEKGLYKAPRNKLQLNDYQWFCLEHIREHNENWDYLGGMSQAEIEAFMKDAMHGHRPTWSRESHLNGAHAKLQDALNAFVHFDGKIPIKKSPALPAKIRKALAVMELEHPYTTQILKARYRIMVKKHHPDANRGNQHAEEIFKSITVAYKVLEDYIRKN